MQASSKQIGLKAADQIPALLAYWDKNEICRFANLAYLEWYGKSQEVMIDKMSKQELLGPKYGLHYPYIREVLKGNIQSFDMEVGMPNGELKYSHATYTPDIENGNVIGFTALIADITIRKQLEISNAKSEKLFSNLLESAPDAIVIINSSGTIQLANHQATAIFGYSKTELLRKGMELLIQDEYRAENNLQIEKYFNPSTVKSIEKDLNFYGIRKNGEKFRAEMSLSPTQSEDGILLMASIRDITARVKMETELAESNKRNSIFIQQAPNAIAMFDKEMRYMAASQKWIEDYGLKDREIVGHSHYVIFPEIGDEWKQKHQRCLKGEINQCDEAPFERADGSTQWLTWDVRPWYVSEDHIGGLLMYTADITAIKEKEQEKQRIEEILETTNTIARIGTWEMNLRQEKLLWSSITREIHEVQEDFVPDLATGINFYKEGKTRDLISKAVSEAIEKGTPFDLELELVTAKGNPVWVRSIGQAAFVNGKCQRVYGIFQDISSIKNAEINLNRANEELKVILNSESVSIIGTDTAGLITHFNKGAAKMLQYSSSEMIGKQSPATIHVHEEVVNIGAKLSAQLGHPISGFDIFAACAKNKAFNTLEWTYVRKDGSKLIVLLVITPLKDAHGGTYGYLGMATDISERVENQQKLKEAKENLEILAEKLTSQNTQLANFAHIASHNLRAPASNLNALLQHYNSSDDPELKDAIIGNFETVSNHLSSTLDTLVDTLKIQDEGSKNMEILYFEEILAKTKEILVAHIRESEVQIIADFSKAPKITFNKIFLESVFLNLVGNAIKYRSPDRKPIIELKTEYSYNRIILTIADNGLGIDLKQHGKNLFGLNKTFHKHPEAKGIGLFLTKNHIEAMGGAITVRSEVGKGTTFIVKF
ncbi:PAS domain S-box protein [uncultured Cyclobacterium sp.]|uniref:PAS domain S-box protein n=1 Tax=uncultured Cyclobacterium sp. TaxID=453820 RepID=UPI0030ED1165|tara:strand:- start:17488 stop:20139 length:2652 start_codon:yes stop_codon:yes gene_type:complete